jgi:hypothetical protein
MVGCVGCGINEGRGRRSGRTTLVGVSAVRSICRLETVWKTKEEESHKLEINV